MILLCNIHVGVCHATWKYSYWGQKNLKLRCYAFLQITKIWKIIVPLMQTCTLETQNIITYVLWSKLQSSVCYCVLSCCLYLWLQWYCWRWGKILCLILLQDLSFGIGFCRILSVTLARWNLRYTHTLCSFLVGVYQ